MRRLVGFCVLALVLVACGNAAETIAERAIEADSGGDVDVDFSNDGETVSVEFDDEDGGGSATFGGGDVPDGFPIPVPNGGEVIQVVETPEQTVVAIQWPMSEFDSLVEVYTDFFSDFGDAQFAEGSGEVSFFSAYSDEEGLSVNLSEAGEVVLATIASQP